MARCARQKQIRSCEAGRKRGVGKMNARLALAFRPPRSHAAIKPNPHIWNYNTILSKSVILDNL